MKIFVPILAAVALSACAYFKPAVTQEAGAEEVVASYQRVDVDGPVATAAERAACDAAGGEISRAGMLGREHCIQTYPDAGKACKGEADCTGTCRAPDGSVQAGDKATGVCQSEDVPFGCYAVVEGGIVQHTLCVD